VFCNRRQMRTQLQFALTGLVLLSAPVPALACEPIVPFVKAVGGPSVLTASLIFLTVVVLVKSAAFARFQKKLSFSKALLWMLAANVFTSIIGLMAPAMIGSGLALFIGLPVIWGLCLLPAHRAIAAAPLTPLARWSPRSLAFGMTAGLVFSYLLLSISRMVQDSDGFALWIAKILALYVALIFGIALTALWEEWVVWWLSRSDEDDLSFVRPVIRANVIVLVAVMLISAAFMIPKRLKSPGANLPKPSKVAVEQAKS
jgi:hypothetical protein